MTHSLLAIIILEGPVPRKTLETSNPLKKDAEKSGGTHLPQMLLF
ncbi:hypothetical protein X975_07138, partial [Stegodyphus mimosarum]